MTPIRGWRLLLGVVLAAGWTASSSAAEEAASAGRQAASDAPVRRGDAVADPLLLLLRTAEIRRELALDARQIERIEEEIAKVNDPLWCLRDAQFIDADRSARAWRLVDQVEGRLGTILKPRQLTRMRQLVLQARGLNALATAHVIEALGLSPEQVRQIGEGLEEVRRLSARARPSSVEDADPQRQRAAESAEAWRKKTAALLSSEQEQRLRRLAGEAFNFDGVRQRYARAPEIRGVTQWINSPPLTLASQRGKVVAVHFFTFGCINCIHNQPACCNWHEQFKDKDVVVLGIHTPETQEEHQLESVRKAIQDQGIAYPVAVDNGKENWNAWANNMWPAVYLIDKAGYIRYWWYGELNWQGAQGERMFRDRIKELLAE